MLRIWDKKNGSKSKTELSDWVYEIFVCVVLKNNCLCHIENQDLLIKYTAEDVEGCLEIIVFSC